MNLAIPHDVPTKQLCVVATKVKLHHLDIAFGAAIESVADQDHGSLVKLLER